MTDNPIVETNAADEETKFKGRIDEAWDKINQKLGEEPKDLSPYILIAVADAVNNTILMTQNMHNVPEEDRLRDWDRTFRSGLIVFIGGTDYAQSLFDLDKNKYPTIASDIANLTMDLWKVRDDYGEFKYQRKFKSQNK